MIRWVQYFFLFFNPILSVHSQSNGTSDRFLCSTRSEAPIHGKQQASLPEARIREVTFWKTVVIQAFLCPLICGFGLHHSRERMVDLLSQRQPLECALYSSQSTQLFPLIHCIDLEAVIQRLTSLKKNNAWRERYSPNPPYIILKLSYICSKIIYFIIRQRHGFVPSKFSYYTSFSIY